MYITFIYIINIDVYRCILSLFKMHIYDATNATAFMKFGTLLLICVGKIGVKQRCEEGNLLLQ